ncbi:MAG: hypothetical protein V4737_06250 [Curtobacterium sp.]
MLGAAVLPAAPASASSAGPASAPHGLEAGISTVDRLFDGAAARAAGADASTVDDFATGWVIAGGRVENVTVNDTLVEAVLDSGDVARACSGRNRWDYTGIQLNIYLNSCNTTRLLGAIGAGAGGATLVGIVTAATGLGAAAAGAIAGGLAIAGGVLTSCSAKGRGVAIHNIPPGPIVWCNGQ